MARFQWDTAPDRPVTNKIKRQDERGKLKKNKQTNIGRKMKWYNLEARPQFCRIFTEFLFHNPLLEWDTDSFFFNFKSLLEKLRFQKKNHFWKVLFSLLSSDPPSFHSLTRLSRGLKGHRFLRNRIVPVFLYFPVSVLKDFSFFLARDFPSLCLKKLRKMMIF